MDSFKLHEAQKTIARDKHRFRVVNCGRRFGKTVLAIDTMKGRAAIPNSRIAYIAPTYQQARDIAWAQLKKDCRESALSINEARLEINLVNESIITLRGWESIETLRGQLFDLVVLDEVASMRNFWEAWQEVVRPTLTDRKGEALFISTPKGFNHFYDLYNLQETDIDFSSYHYTSYDNPFIPSEEIDTAKKQLTETRFAQEYMADFRTMEGLVYKEFKRARHIIDPMEMPLDFKEFIVGVDFGYTHPCAVISIRRDAMDNYYITDEFYERGKTEPEIVEYVAALGANKVYPDPEAAASVESLRRKGVNVREVLKGKGSVKNGIDKVRELFKADKLKISSKCKNLIWEIETYAYDDEKNDDNPIKENDDAVDAMRYALMMNIGTGTGRAFVHYSPSSQPIQMNSLAPELREAPKNAYVHIPNL